MLTVTDYVLEHLVDNALTDLLGDHHGRLVSAERARWVLQRLALECYDRGRELGATWTLEGDTAPPAPGVTS